MTRFTKSIVAGVAGLALVASAPIAWADEVGGDEIVVTGETVTPPAAEPVVEDDSSNAVAIIVDLLIGRPTLLMAGVAGAAFYVISLPITLPSDTEPDARETFLTPARQFFGNSLGADLNPAG